jgi:hypothetical protein
VKKIKAFLSIPHCLRLVSAAALVVACLFSANTAGAGTIADNSWMDTSAPNPGSDALSASSLNGWFFSGNSDPSLPAPADPSQPWTSAANIATLNSWLSAVTELGDDPSLLSQLSGMGMITSPDSGLTSVVQTSFQESITSSPEPFTLGLLIGGLAFLLFYAAVRTRRMRNR